MSSNGATVTNDTSTVIIGAGIIGCATAYYLSRSSNTDPSKIHIIEASAELFSSASGKSGGFLAEDWFGPATASLGALSFALHKQLAEQHNGFDEWGYSQSTGSSLIDASLPPGSERGEDWLRQGRSRAEAAGVHEFHGGDDGPAWLAKLDGSRIELIGEQSSVAQVDPMRLCHFLLRAATAAGVHLHQPVKPTSLQIHPSTGQITGLVVQRDASTEYVIPCTRLLISAGAWTPNVFHHLFPDATHDVPVTSLAGHSLVVRSPRWTRDAEPRGCHAVFTTTATGLSPEIFSRVGGEIYVAGLNDATIPLPRRPEEAAVNATAISELTTVARRYLGAGGKAPSDLEVVREGLCFRPVTSRGVPILDRVPDKMLGRAIKTPPSPVGGVFVAAGHGPWGISHSLGTGKVMAEMLEGKALSADVSGLNLRHSRR